MPDLQITQEGIFFKLLRLYTEKARDLDKTPIVFLKRCAEWILHFKVLFEKLLLTGVLLLNWLCVTVIPVFRSAVGINVGNYR